jgi:SAM-dependent methyltransferase
MDGPGAGQEARWAAAMPDTYDEPLGPALFAPFARKVAGRAAGPRPRSVLELAAGTGILTAELVARLPGVPVTATDLNGAMVSYGSRQVPAARWRTADAQSLPVPDGAFDLVVCQFGVMVFPDKPAAFAEASRVLAPTGLLLFTVWDTVGSSPFPAALTDALAEVLPDDPPDFVTRIPHGYADPDRIRADLAAAGLTGDVERVVLRGEAASAGALAEGFCRGTPLLFGLQGRGDVDELTAAVAERMAARLGDGPVSGDLAAFVVTAAVRPTPG